MSYFKSLKQFSFAVLASVLIGALLSIAPLVTKGPQAQAAPGDSCATDSIYLMSNGWGGMQDVKYNLGQILEFKVDSNGTVDPASANIFSETIKGEPKPGTPEVFVFDALGVGTDCTFYFVLTNDPHSTPASVEVYRYNPLQDTDGTPKVVQRAMPMNSPVTGNVVAGAVAPNGDYYFGYYSRNTAADTSGAQGERLRFHLYRYVYQSGHDPDSIVQPIDRSGEVAHVDIEVPEEFMENASFGALFGDLVFNASGDLVLFSSYENPGF